MLAIQACTRSGLTRLNSQRLIKCTMKQRRSSGSACKSLQLAAEKSRHLWLICASDRQGWSCKYRFQLSMSCFSDWLSSVCLSRCLAALICMRIAWVSNSGLQQCKRIQVFTCFLMGRTCADSPCAGLPQCKNNQVFTCC